MSRPKSPRPEVASGVPTPITELAHLAPAARRLGQTDRVIRVDAGEPQKVRTPGRRPGQWLMSGEPVSAAGWSPLAAHLPSRDMADRSEGGHDR